VKFVYGFCGPRSSSAAAAQALAILVQALVTANFAVPAQPVTDPSNQKSQVLPFQVLPVLFLPVLDLLVRFLPVHLELEVKLTAV
jgi:cell shape-determining protein MreD